jgi:hypothetical protein
MRHGDRSVHPFKAAVAHPVDLSIWQRLQALGTFKVSVVVGVMMGLLEEVEPRFILQPAACEVVTS